jgi:phosphatidylglycerophosphatase A
VNVAAKRPLGVRAAFVLGTWFGVGYFPGAPGTAGTLAALPLYAALRPLGAPAVLVAAALVAAVGVWSASVVVRSVGAKDPQIVVIDEVAGVLVTLAAATSWKTAALGVVLFRVFDQCKPWPARTFEQRLPSGWGVVMDDLAAGVWGAAVLTAVTRGLDAL